MIASEMLTDNESISYVNDTTPGYTRIKKGKGFSYIDDQGNKITDSSTIDRIKSLVIPPGWTNVWISKNPSGHIQATGIDAKGRKQYRYHSMWTAMSQENKFNHMKDFSLTLPHIRGHINRDLAEKAQSRRKVMAAIIWLLENTLIRIGNSVYEKENKSYGLTTLKNRHVDIEGNFVTFQFKGKSGVYHNVNIRNKRVAKIIRECKELPGQQLFEYINEQGEMETVGSDHINGYLKEISGNDITAKDFRTWHGTVYAALTLNDLGSADTKTSLKKNMTQAAKMTARKLGNKPATARSYYIHPAVFTAYQEGTTVSHITDGSKKKLTYHDTGLHDEEEAVLNLIDLYTHV